MDRKGAPALPNNCNSWCIVVRGTNNVVRETFNKSTADRVANEESMFFEVVPTVEWLRRFNTSLR